ncbi:hypothetical protein OAM77_04850 [Alphaproteobacteria bacterium]|nr:hypothetical protein [Alphaproteobacteria bacterium]
MKESQARFLRIESGKNTPEHSGKKIYFNSKENIIIAKEKAEHTTKSTQIERPMPFMSPFKVIKFLDD